MCEVSSQGLLHRTDAIQVVQLIKEGALCVLPSDSSYVLTGLPTVRGFTGDLDTVLERNRMPMSLAFGDLEQADDLISLSTMAQDFIRRLTPGGLTFVARPRPDDMRAFALRRLNAPEGTVGVRLTESPVETQIAHELYYPLPSTPVRRSDHAEVCTVNEALSTIADRVSRLQSPRKIAVIDGPVPYPGRLSTVVREEQYQGLWRIVITREGAISRDKIAQVAADCMYEDVIVRLR